MISNLGPENPGNKEVKDKDKIMNKKMDRKLFRQEK
jgi:hypothetical protein